LRNRRSQHQLRALTTSKTKVSPGAWGRLPSLFPVLGLTTGPHPLVVAVTVLRYLCTHLNLQARLEQLKLTKTDPLT
jgi:hypothetical protein